MKRVGQKLRDELELEIGRRKIEGLSQHSLRAMRDAADSFCLSVDCTSGATAADLTPAHVVEWIDAMRQRGLSPATLLVRYRYLATLMRGLVSAGIIPVSPMKDLRAPRARAPIVEFPNDAEVERLLNPLRYQDVNGARDLAVIWFLAAAGLRRAELIGMRWSTDAALCDLDLETGRARVLGKGRRERHIPLLPGMLSVLEAYLVQRGRSPHRGSPALWLGQRGVLTTSSVNAIVASRGRDAGLLHLHPHALRHAWAHRMLSSGVGEGDVMVLGGWSNRAMLSRYGAYAASERAFAAVESRLEALEPWGRSVQSVAPVPARRRAGGGRPLPSTGGDKQSPRPQTRRRVRGKASVILPSRRRTGTVGA
jgi:integrase/recombinase XerD